MADKRIMLRINGGEDPIPKAITTASGIPLYIPKDTKKGVRINDTRKLSPTTGLPLKDTDRKSIDVDPDLIQDIVTHARNKGIDPLTALAISYQETGLNKNAPYNLNPMVFGKPTGNAEEGMRSLYDQFKYGKNLQDRGVIPQGEDYYIQSNNGYGVVKRGHADLEGANRIYGLDIPEGGINLKNNPLYGKTVLSLRELLKTNPQIMEMVNPVPTTNKVKLSVKK